ncbi:MAG: hypothetical protein F6K10_14370 [Moorea sp. SIO2B7]|nr:hypothetical protein [Moorena sp. SIO2B7]
MKANAAAEIKPESTEIQSVKDIEWLWLVESMVKLQQQLSLQQNFLQRQRWQIEEMHKQIETLVDELDQHNNHLSNKDLAPSSYNQNQELLDNNNGFPRELINFSVKVEENRVSDKSRHQGSVGPKNYKTQSYAKPIMTFNHRDTKALIALFERHDIEEIENNINKILLVFYPEPCWEETSFDFLADIFRVES